jgi:HPt (histidine-containing phosphotransfer) domain-containing protein
MNHTNQEYYSNFDSLEKMFDGDAESLKEIFSIFLKDVPTKIKGIRVDCENKQWAAAARKVHQIKPFYGYSSNKETERLIEELEKDLINAAGDFDFENKLILLELKTECIVEVLRTKFII